MNSIELGLILYVASRAMLGWLYTAYRLDHGITEYWETGGIKDLMLRGYPFALPCAVPFFNT